MSSIDSDSGKSAARAAWGMDGDFACRGSWTSAQPPSLSISSRAIAARVLVVVPHEITLKLCDLDLAVVHFAMALGCQCSLNSPNFRLKLIAV